MDTNSMKEPNKDGSRTQCMKLGRPSDTWSLGCILYQMTYGHTPFSHLQMIPKLQKIIDPTYPIEYPEIDNPYLIEVMKGCLLRDPKERMTIPQLLSHPFLKPDRVMRQLQDCSLKRVEWIVQKTIASFDNGQKSNAEEIAKRIHEMLNASLLIN
jgi:serine/threonine protein kinase